MIKNKSFTLIELLVVIVIIGILAGVIIVSTSSSISKANFAKGQAFSNTVQQELLLNLVSEWTFDNESNPAEDTWGNNDGIAQGTYRPKASGECVYGGCYLFDGISNYINCGKGNLNNISKITFSAWINPFSAGEGTYGRVFQKAETMLHVAPSSIAFYSDRVTTDASWYFKMPLFKEWSYITFIYDNADIANKPIIYINGNKEIGVVRTNPVGLVVDDSSFDFLIGNDSIDGARTFDGLIDDVRVYNTILSTAQIKQEYIAGLNSLLANNNISKEEYDQRIESLAKNN